MKRIALLLITIIACQAAVCTAQNPISGIINEYASILSIDDCGIIQLDNTSNFQTGDRVLLMQMKGLSINQNNNSDFGTIIDYGSAGLFEFADISSIAGNYIYLNKALLNQYDTQHSCQLIKVPQFSNALVTETLTAKAWDGQTGGVLAFEVDSTLSLNAHIDASAKGFRGAALQNIESDCYFLFNTPDYFYETNNWRAALKGESAVTAPSGKEAGRGPLASGGGGGNDHNAGGGGGGNAGKGGVGGKQIPPGIFFCDGDYPGLGGLDIANTSQRLFLGGGGGAPHVDDANAGSTGGNGGGIIMIKANSINGNGFKIKSNGSTPETSPGDGGAGAGAGGTILLYANDISAADIEVKGGDGGNINNGGGRCYGPGGAGGGGICISKQNNLNVTLSGGNSGINLNPSADCDNPQSDAGTGDNGTYLSQDSIWLENTTIFPVFSSSSDSLLVCTDSSYQLSVFPQIPDANYQWQIDTGNGFEDLSDNSVFSNTQSPTLDIYNTGDLTQGINLQCQVSLNCETGNSPLIPLYLSELPEALISQSGTDSLIIVQSQSTNYDMLSWYLNGEIYNQNSDSISLNIQNTGIYNISLVATNSCGSDSAYLSIVSGENPQADFTETLNSFCTPFTVSFQNESQFADSLSWYFEGAEPAFSSEVNPLANYTIPGIYDLMLIAHNSLGNDTLFLPDYISAYQAPNAAFSLESNGLTVNTINQAGDPGEFVYTWNMGDGSALYYDWQVTHNYSETGSYLVEFSVENEACYASSNRTVNLINSANKNIKEELYFMVQPNPFEDSFSLSIRSAKDSFISIRDLHGRIVFERVLEAGSQKTQIELDNPESRLLILQIQSGNQLITKRLIQKKTAR